MPRSIVPSLVIVLAALASPVFGRPQEPNVVTRESTLTGVVDRIERFGRTVTFHTADNIIQTVAVDPSMKLFDDLKTGDVVTVRMIESVVAQVRPEAKPGPVRDTTEEARKTAGDHVVQQLTVVVTIDEIDSQQQSVTYHTYDNRRTLRGVADKRLLEGLHPGDRVEVTLTRARAVSIERGGR